MPQTYTVTSAAGDNSTVGSLGYRIAESNTNLGADTIVFDLGAMGTNTITLTEALPGIADSLTITGPGRNLLEIVRAGGTIFSASPAAPAVVQITDLELSSNDTGVAYGVNAGSQVSLTVQRIDAHDFGDGGVYSAGSLIATDITANSNEWGVFYTAPTAAHSAVLTDVTASNNTYRGAELLLSGGGGAAVYDEHLQQQRQRRNLRRCTRRLARRHRRGRPPTATPSASRSTRSTPRSPTSPT